MEKRECLFIGCNKIAEFEIYDSNERRPDTGPTDACIAHVGELLGSVPPVEPVGPWMVYEIKQ